MIHSSIIPRGMKYKMVIFKNPLPPEITNIFSIFIIKLFCILAAISIIRNQHIIY